jgi:hypothetical protein
MVNTLDGIAQQTTGDKRSAAEFGVNSFGPLGESEMHNIGTGNVLCTLVTECECVDAGKEMFAGTKKDRTDSDMHLVNKSGLEILPDRGNPAAKPYISAVGRVGCPFQCGMNSAREELEGCAAIHGDWRPGVMGKHEYGSVIRRVVTPPALPIFIRPWPTDGAEHVPADDPSSDTFETPSREVVIDAIGALSITA